MLLLGQSSSSLKGHKKMEKCLRTGRNPVSFQVSEGNMENQETTGSQPRLQPLKGGGIAYLDCHF